MHNEHSRSPPPSYSPTRGQGYHGRWRSASHSQTVSSRMSTHSDSIMDPRELVLNRTDSIVDGNDSDLGPLQFHYCTAYSAAELKTFHCDRVRKMPLSGLDPSMLIGFLCRDEADWWDFRRRVSEVSHLYSFLQALEVILFAIVTKDNIFCARRTAYLAV